MIPVARSEKLLIQSVGNEVIVYDEVNNSSHCLNPMAARVWELCDGQHSVKDIAQLLEKELDVSQTEDVDMRGLVWLTLEELERYQLIKEYLKQPTGIASFSRRKVVKTGVLVGGFAVGTMLPVVKSIVAPAPAMALSQECLTEGQRCDRPNSHRSCCDGLECDISSPNNKERRCVKNCESSSCEIQFGSNPMFFTIIKDCPQGCVCTATPLAGQTVTGTCR
ncbi:MAG: PqqD family protein [Okeania sp. SIO2C9]|uniref:PqqD family protein n=1 Tax=Okeania sp. SIO2C9 TaxID=2607791 RepID=UPI0013C1B46B|nr:PqqD family protein [Okeania sp. SIO2C9]NEQ76554.1 PqqD family protein [Okeania sp. SIO2C9]